MKEVTKANILEEPTFADRVKELSPYDRRWLDAYLGEALYNLTEAERIAGRRHTSENALRVAAYRTFERMKPIIGMLMEDAGLSDTRIYSKIMEKWDAKKIVRVFNKFGKEVASYEVDDNHTQMKVLEFALKVKGLLNNKVPYDIDRQIELELARIAASRDT
ncbi:MAG TPA: hypothetical protein PLM29_00725 [Deltaproteobacteria bacterium]|nr:hypothetical protein [Deltaproteobacteria bacterium]HPR53152.1 hypothetical protein [Deltaproteobacteria bacterium]